MRLLQRLRFGHWFGLLLLVSVAVRVFGLATPRLWYDEINTWWFASLPLDRMIAATAGDVHPPLFYFLEWCMVHVLPNADPAWAIRLPSALAGVAALPVALGVAKQLKLSTPTTLVGLGLLAVAPTQIYYGQEARMYSLLQLETLTALWALLSRRWWAFGLASAAALWTHNYGWIYLAMFVGLGVGRELFDIRPARWRGLLLASGGAGVAYVPWLAVLAQQMSTVKTNWWTPSTTPGALVESINAQIFYPGLPGLFNLLGQVVVYALSIYAATQAVKRWRDPNGLLLGYLSFAPTVAALAAELVYRPILLPRALIGAAAPLYLFWAWALGLGQPSRRWLAAMALGVLVAVGVVAYYPTTATNKGGGYVTANSITTPQPGDLIYHLNPGTLAQFRLDYHGDLPQYVAPNSVGSLGTLSPATLTALGVTQQTLDSLSWRRAWVVWSGGPNTSTAEDTEIARILNTYPHRQTQHLNLTVGGYHLADGGVWLIWR